MPTLNIKPLSVPSKALSQSITSASMAFKLKNIKGWAKNNLGQNVDLTPSDFGIDAFGVFRNETGTVMEIFQFDPTTIASPSITILKRGLGFSGDATTENTFYKLDWPAGSTIVQLGTDTPQFLQWLKDYIDGIAIAGSPDASATTKGIGKTSVPPVTPTEPIFVGDNDPRVPTANPNTLFTRKLATTTVTSSATPSINTDTYDRLTITAQTENITSMTSGLSGSPVDGQKLNIRINTGASTNTTLVAYSSNYNYTNSIVVNKPTGTQANDLMFATLHADGQPTAPSGWTQIAFRDYMSGLQRTYLFYKLAGGSEPSNYTFSKSGSSDFSGTISSLRGGFNILEPIEINNISNINYITNDTILRAGSVNIPKSNSNLVFIGFNNSYSSTPPTGFTEFYDINVWAYDCMSIKNWTSYGITGDIDATMTGSSINKHAFLIPLNPSYNITWGTSYAETFCTLPTKINGPSYSDIDLRYNSTLAKWETIIPLGASLITKNAGTSSKNLADSSVVQTIAHGLNGIPNKIKITSQYNDATITFICDFIYIYKLNSSNGIYYGSADGSSNALSSTTSNILSTSDVNMSAYQSGVVTVDTTNITITWTRVNSPTGTAYLLWEAEL